jgi:hypothetical protein
MQLRPPARITPIVIAAALIFIALITLQCASQRLSDSRTTVQDKYEQLARVLTTAGVLPLGSLGQMRAGLNLLGAGELTPLPGVPETVSAYGALDGAVRVYAGDSGVVIVELDSAVWRRLPRGDAAASLKRIARLGYYAQAQSVRRARGLRQPPSDFSFRVNGGSEQYDIIPLFDDDKCTTLRITRAH